MKPVSYTHLDVYKRQLLGKEVRRRMLIPIFQEHNDKIEKLVGKEYAKVTLGRYQTCISHTKEFLKWKYEVSDIGIKKIDYAFLNDFEYYLRTEKSCNNNSAVKYLKTSEKSSGFVWRMVGWIVFEKTCKKAPKASVQQGFHCSCFARNENIAIGQMIFPLLSFTSSFIVLKISASYFTYCASTP